MGLRVHMGLGGSYGAGGVYMGVWAWGVVWGCCLGVGRCGAGGGVDVGLEVIGGGGGSCGAVPHFGGVTWGGEAGRCGPHFPTAVVLW